MVPSELIWFKKNKTIIYKHFTFFIWDLFLGWGEYKIVNLLFKFLLKLYVLNAIQIQYANNNVNTVANNLKYVVLTDTAKMKMSWGELPQFQLMEGPSLWPNHWNTLIWVCLWRCLMGQFLKGEERWAFLPETLLSVDPTTWSGTIRLMLALMDSTQVWMLFPQLWMERQTNNHVIDTILTIP